MYMRDCASVIALQTASGSEIERITVGVRAVAPASIATMATERRCQRGLSATAKRESAANRAIVSVSTVVVRVGNYEFPDHRVPQTHRHASRSYDCVWLKWV